MHYLDFDLSIEPAAAGYQAKILNSPAGQAVLDFALPFSDLELENYLLRMGQARRSVRRIESPQIEAAKAFGGTLFRTVFDEEVLNCFHESLNVATGQETGLRIRLRLNSAPELAGLPWEYLYNPASNRFLSLSVETPIVRYLDLSHRINPLAVAPPLRVLAVIANPAGLPDLDVEQEWARLQETLKDLAERQLIELQRLQSPTLVGLQRTVRRGAYHILHFIGHGDFDADTQDGMLVFTDESGSARPVGGQELGMMLCDEKTLRLAVLNACEGGRSSPVNPFAGVAQSLVQQGIPAVVAMQFEISDAAAVTLSYEFYSALADGYPVDAALAEARKAIFAHQEGTEWGTPVLYMRASDGRIFNLEPAQLIPSGPAVPIPSHAQPASPPRSELRLALPGPRLLIVAMLLVALAVAIILRGPGMGRLAGTGREPGNGQATGEALHLPPTATPRPTPVSTSGTYPTAISLTTGTVPDLSYTFSPREDAWGEPLTIWHTLEVAPRQYVYEGRGNDNVVSSDPPNNERMQTWQNYAVALEFRVVQPGIVGDDYPDGWLTIRYTEADPNGCHVTNISFDVTTQEMALSVDGGSGCPYAKLARTQASFTDAWHTLQVEARDETIAVLLDGQQVMTSGDIEPARGFFFLNVSPNAVIQFANINVFRLAEGIP